MINVQLPIPPSVNHCYRNAVVRGRVMRVLTAAAKDFYQRSP